MHRCNTVVPHPGTARGCCFEFYPFIHTIVILISVVIYSLWNMVRLVVLLIYIYPQSPGDPVLKKYVVGDSHVK